MKRPSKIYLLLILLLALLLRLPGIFWGHVDRSNGIILEPDEFQHVSLASEILHRIDSTMGQPLKKPFWNSRAYGIQLAYICFVGAELGFKLESNQKKVLVGRFFSAFYSLGLILVVFYLGLQLFGRAGPALWSALCLAIFDLNITLSHYALPEMMYNFSFHLSVLGVFVWFSNGAEGTERTTSGWKLKLPAIALICLGNGLTLGAKLDFLPLLISPVFLLVTHWFQTRKPLIGLGWALLIFCGSCGVFLLAHGAYFPWEEIKFSFFELRGLNQDAIPKDQHWIYNPMLYPIAIVAGTSLPLVTTVVSCFWKNREKIFFNLRQTSRAPAGLYFILILILEFGVRWSLDTTFVRRADIFLPVLALSGGFALCRLIRIKKKLNAFWVWGLVIYTIGISLVNQSNFWWDTRYQALDYLLQESRARSYQYSTYSYIPGMPREGNDPSAPSIHVFHETYYGRYWKYFTTPFKVPKCCNEVYNCWSLENCQSIQAIFRGQSDYRLAAFFPTRTLFPERWLFKKIFGTYETFLGDVRIYENQ